MSLIHDILDGMCSKTPSNWRKMALFRKNNKNELKEVQGYILSVLDKMYEKQITAEHLANEIGYSLDDVRDILRGNRILTIKEVNDINKVLFS